MKRFWTELGAELLIALGLVTWLTIALELDDFWLRLLFTIIGLGSFIGGLRWLARQEARKTWKP